MMKTKLLLSLSAASALTLLSNQAFAIGANQGFYFAGQLGAAYNNYPDINSTTTTPIHEEKNEFTWGITGGFNFSVTQYQRMNQFVYEDQDAPSGQNNGAWLVGGSVGIMSLGNTQYTRGSENGKLTNYSLNFLVNTTYAYQGYYIWGETGLGAAITDGSGTNFHSSKSRTNGVFILGGGVGYSWHYWNIFFRYDHYFGKDYPASIAENSGASASFPAMNVFLGGVAYTF